ncbi:terpenoid synthase [Penicillium bovifimosum]|uniref:Terpenoid synthase n=1 Tax=Penicillium bovifimosum TaxID=126998 RepID=A0A9W9GML5_9EURO|nr:terpenoid synthase [Penicillium bovifimosum]KAJ5124288.1 terpenoid synthase [Penicillium bovifimosum]
MATGQSRDWASVGTLEMTSLPSMAFVLSIAVLAAFWKLTRQCSPKRPAAEKIHPSSTVSKRDYEDIVNEFLQGISYQPPQCVFDVALSSRVENHLLSHGISPEFIKQIGRCIKTATEITTFTYPFVSHEVQEAIALYATYVISIDDLTTDILPDLQGYVAQLVAGRPHHHELLRGFTHFLGSQQRLFGQFGGDMIVKGTLEFISSAVIEQGQDRCLNLTQDAADYLVYFRAKTGVAEPFAFFFFPEDSNPEEDDLRKYIAAIPSIMLILGYVNDLLSFYKEESKVDDYPGFVQNHAQVYGLTSLQSLRQLMVETLAEVRKIRNIFFHDAAMTDRIDKFIYGYVFYHLCSRRYRLDELDIPAALESRIRYHQMVKVPQ